MKVLVSLDLDFEFYSFLELCSEFHYDKLFNFLFKTPSRVLSRFNLYFINKDQDSIVMYTFD